MACMFSFEFFYNEKNKEIVFKSRDNEVYNLTYSYDDLRLTFVLTWKNRASMFVILEICDKQYKHSTSERSEVVDDNQVHIYFNRSHFRNNQSNGPFKCVVTVMPRVKLQDISVSSKEVSEARGFSPVIEEDLQQLSDDMRNFLETGDLSDVTLCNGSIEIPAHKLILSVRSSVFAKILKDGMKKNGPNRVDISKMTDAVLKDLVTFIYTGSVTIENMRMARDLYIAADQYDIQNLRSICSSILKNVTLDSVLDTLVLANTFDDQTLKQSSMNFILKNYSEVKSHKNWETFVKKYKALSIEILSFRN